MLGGEMGQEEEKKKMEKRQLYILLGIQYRIWNLTEI